MIGVRTDSSDKKVCTGLVATTRFRCRIVVTRNEKIMARKYLRIGVTRPGGRHFNERAPLESSLI